ncbi:hypothetical protein [Caballeronia sp. LZ001]|uniref:hypothetical protein n=1 Tax=Caballeronia sp. LZ001 TaxID=3038553 RepID=UPI00285D7762|nr:hypothetical protein [Caballeronia sp. LZ001]MDR5802172.1 hypothetical protein [Caballeronia sp. LZ001]
MTNKDKTAEKAFDAFANRYDHESNDWLDMNVQTFFQEGFKAAIESRVLAESDKQEAVGEVLLIGKDADLKEVAWRKGKMPPVGTKLYAHPIASADVRDAETPKQSWVSWASDELIRHRAKGSADELQAKRFHMAVQLGLLEFEDVEQIDAAIAANRASEEGEKS